MTDNEIIKALEEYRNSKIVQSDNGVISIGNILDLINRQQAEIERLQKENNQFADIGKMYSEIKSTAIKEYREKAAIKLAENARSDYWHWIDDTLYEVEKELIGDAK